MTEHDEVRIRGGAGEAEGGVGDAETAGETTAAAVTGSGDANDRPVGADTMVKVADNAETDGGDGD